MIGSFTYETIGFNPTFVIIVGSIVMALFISFIWAGVSRGFSDEAMSSGSVGILFLGAAVIFLASVPEGMRVSNFEIDSISQNREATFTGLGYTDLQVEGDNWAANYNGEYASGSLKLIEDKQTYEIYKFESN